MIVFIEKAKVWPGNFEKSPWLSNKIDKGGIKSSCSIFFTGAFEFAPTNLLVLLALTDR